MPVFAPVRGGVGTFTPYTLTPSGDIATGSAITPTVMQQFAANPGNFDVYDPSTNTTYTMDASGQVTTYIGAPETAYYVDYNTGQLQPSAAAQAANAAAPGGG